MTTYYIQDTRSCVGNCAMWWREGGAGYTTELEEAGEYEEEEALSIERNRSTDKAIPCHIVRRATVTHVRLERLGREIEASKDQRIHLAASGKSTACGVSMAGRRASTSSHSVTCDACRAVP